MNLDISPTRQMRKELERENRRWPDHLISVPRDQWPKYSEIPPSRRPVELWRSRGFLLQVYREADGPVERLTIQRTQHDGRGWVDGITWDDLMRLKAQCGRAAKWAVEIYPSAADSVEVANLRHLWVLSEPPSFAWRNK